MQKQPETTSRASQTTLSQDLVALARYGLRSRTGKLILAAAVIAGGLFLGWDWLTAAGLASIVLALLPCAVMGALGLCMIPGKKNLLVLCERHRHGRNRYTGRAVCRHG